MKFMGEKNKAGKGNREFLGWGWFLFLKGGRPPYDATMSEDLGPGQATMGGSIRSRGTVSAKALSQGMVVCAGPLLMRQSGWSRNQ